MRCLVFEIWSILYFTFVMHSGLRRIHNFLYAPHFCTGLCPPHPRRGCCSQASVAFGLNPQSHWLASESGLQKTRTFIFASPQFRVNPYGWRVEYGHRIPACRIRRLNGCADGSASTSVGPRRLPV